MLTHACISLDCVEPLDGLDCRARPADAGPRRPDGSIHQPRQCGDHSSIESVVETVNRFLPYYSSVHRGAGFKSRVSTAAYNDAHDTIARFVGADPSGNTVIFGKNTTEAINKLAYRFPLADDSVVISTEMEHHSNDLPWRARAHVVRARVTGDGRLDEDDVDRLLDAYGRRVALLTVCGASNVTGLVQPIHRLARKAHAVGARILVDAAQLAPHRRIDVKPDDDPEHLDYVAISAHKMYAPFGTGTLIGRRDTFLSGAPEYQGGGTVEIVTPHDVHWAGLPDREEAGSPNVIGAIAMAAAAQALMDAGMDAIAQHEAALDGLRHRAVAFSSHVTIYGPSNTGSAAIALASSPSTSGRSPTRWWRRFSVTRRGSGCEAAASAHSSTSCGSWGSPNRTCHAGTASTLPAIDRESREWFASAWAPTTSSRTSMPWSLWWSGLHRASTRDSTAWCPRPATIGWPATTGSSQPPA